MDAQTANTSDLGFDFRGQVPRPGKVLPCSPIYFRDVTIGISGNGIVIVDKCDEAIFLDHTWRVMKYGSCLYAGTHLKTPRGKTTCLLHRLILQPDEDQHVDHINGNGLDNRRSNLRLCSRVENRWNSRKLKTSATSIFKGVYFDKNYQRRKLSKCWRSGIRCNGEKINLGSFYNEIDAAVAYDRAAIKFFGDFARPNFPHGNTSDAHSPQPRLSGSHRGAGLRFDSGSNFFVWQFPNRGFFPRRGISVEELI